MLNELLDPELMPVYEKLYAVLVGSIILIGLFLLAFLLIVYLPRMSQLRRLEAKISRLQAKIDWMSNGTSTATAEASKTSQKANKLEVCDARL